MLQRPSLPVPRPVVEVLVSHHALNGSVVRVRGGLGGCQHEARVEHLQQGGGRPGRESDGGESVRDGYTMEISGVS